MIQYGWKLLMSIVAVVAASVVVSCSNPQQQSRMLSEAERIADVYPDSALAILEKIDPDGLTLDSLRARYYYVMATAHDSQDHITLSDSMLSFSNDYYRDKDLARSIWSATLLASYRFGLGEREVALRMLDSLSSLRAVPDSLLIKALRRRVSLGTYYGSNEARISRLMAIDKDDNWHPQYKFMLYFDLLFSGKNDSALTILDEFIDKTADDESELRYKFEYEKVGVLEELGLYEESMNLADSLMKEPQGEPIRHYFHLWKAVAQFNRHDHAAAARELEMADSFATAIPADERGYYNSFAYLLHTMLDYQQSGKMSFIRFARINNSQRDNLFAAQNLRQEAARHALEAENQRIILKARNDRQTALIVIIILMALLLSGILIWYARNKKRLALEMLERNEILSKLVDESKVTQNNPSVNETLRRAMLQQLGIIKMVAETPTDQNRDMLRKISAVEADCKDGSLVNWESVYEMIDNLYSGFYSRLHSLHGGVLTDKEERIIALMVAGFSTKEISVITGQTVATIYVRKSSVRKKLGVPEKEDIVAFLRQEAGV